METVEITIEPSSAPTTAPSRKPAARPVRRRVTVPKPAPIGLQIVGLLLLVALSAGTIVLAIVVDDAAVRIAAAAVILIASLVLVTWAALVLGTGLGPKQLLDILTQFLGAVREAEKPDEEEGEEAGGNDQPAEARRALGSPQ